MANFKFNYSKAVKKLILNQFGAAILGIMLFMASRNSVSVSIFTGIIAIFFYLMIDYTSMWDIGSADKISVEGMRMKKNTGKGFISSLFAGIPNFLLGLLCVIFTLFSGMDNPVVVISRNIAIMWESMYSGILWVIFPKTLNIIDNTAVYSYNVLENPSAALYMCLYLVITVPAVIASGLGYIAGFNNFRIIPKKKKENG